MGQEIREEVLFREYMYTFETKGIWQIIQSSDWKELKAESEKYYLYKASKGNYQNNMKYMRKTMIKEENQNIIKA
jgi:hypothetical protein